MTLITTHHGNECNDAIEIESSRHATDEAPSSYRMAYGDNSEYLNFQSGPPRQVGANGITNEVLLAILIDRLEGHQRSKFSCLENERALGSLRLALAHLKERTVKRIERGVEGTHVV